VAGDGAHALAAGLIEAGLVQFGRFAQPDGSFWPVAAHLGWLPSYPALLRQTGAIMADLGAGLRVDRLLAAPGALPVAVALGLASDLPVTYWRGDVRDYTAAYSIEGAYDVGHPTALLLDALLSATPVHELTEQARRVGLEVTTLLAVLDLGRGAAEELRAAGLDVRCALSLGDLLALFAAQGRLPDALRATVEAWQRGETR